jgi:hypothetical protein
VIFGEGQLLERLVHVSNRGNADPAQASVREGAALGEPAVVAARQGQLDLRPNGGLDEEKSRVDYLDLDLQLTPDGQAYRLRKQ